MNIELEKLIDLAIADGTLTDKKKQVLEKKRQELGVDLDEFELVVEAKLHQRNHVNNQVIFSSPSQEKDLKQEAIDNLAKMNISYSQGTLIFHAQEGNLSVVKLLLEAGLNPNIIYIEKIDKKDVSFLALDRAITKGHIEIVKLLLEYGADLNYFDDNFSKPINKAIQSNNIELLNLLIDNGADITKGNNKDENIPIIQAIKLKNIEIVEKLAPKVDLDIICSPSWSKVTPLIYAIDKGEINIAKIMIENGADINKPANSNLETPLIFAIKNKNIEAVKFLIKNGADVNRKRKDGNSPIFMAHQRKLDDILKLLIDAGASPLSEDELLISATLKSKILNNVESSIDYTKRTLWPKIVIGIMIICLGYWIFSGGNSSSSSSNSSSYNSSETPAQSEEPTHVVCPHCNGAGERINQVNGVYGICNSCLGKGIVPKDNNLAD
jgi:ankyrin repeat protein